MEKVSSHESLLERLSWIIRLRWLAVGGVVITSSLAKHYLEISLNISPLFLIALLLGSYNLFFFFWVKGFDKKKPHPARRIRRIANIQISLDLISLATLIHFSGGIENPFVFYFVFHVIIASILLTRWASFWQATLAVFLFLSIAVLEYYGVIAHYQLEGFISEKLYRNPFYLCAISFVFISTLYIAVYMASSVSVTLRKREKSLRHANRELINKDRAKSEYVMRVSHDIKEHLAAVQSCVEPVANGMMGELSKSQKDLLDRADKRTGKLLFFVQALLELSSIRLNEKLIQKQFSFSAVLLSALSNVEPKAEKKNITLKSSIDPKIDNIEGVEEYIEETITNLLANAVKYTPAGGEVTLEVTSHGENILVVVADTGIGISKQALPHIFDEFYRADNARQIERDGTGLGLSIARQVITRHKGRIWAESTEGKGSTFYISLPKRKKYD